MISLAARWSKDPQKQKLLKIAEKLRGRVSKNIKPVFFYPGESSIGVNDDLALDWDLQCGCQPADVRRTMEQILTYDNPKEGKQNDS